MSITGCDPPPHPFGWERGLGGGDAVPGLDLRLRPIPPLRLSPGANQARVPPVGRHRYFHKLYALDTELGDLGAATKAEVLRAMEGHVLAEAELVGTYEKRR